MKKSFIGIMILGLASLGYSQGTDTAMAEVTLSDVTITPLNLAYLEKVHDETISNRVFILEKKASRYDLKESPSFIEGGLTKFQFSQKNGRIIATFNSNGKIMSASEKYKNLKLPPAVRNAIYRKYSDWDMRSNVYLVNYHYKRGAKKVFKIRLTKDGLKKDLRFDVDGNEI